MNTTDNTDRDEAETLLNELADTLGEAWAAAAEAEEAADTALAAASRAEHAAGQAAAHIRRLAVALDLPEPPD